MGVDIRRGRKIAVSQPVLNLLEGHAVCKKQTGTAMLKAILSQYDSTVEKMAKLKAEGKEKTVTYRQLFASKLQLQAMLSYYRTYGLLEDVE